MATTMGIASAVPPGWNYDPAMDRYYHNSGLYVDALDVAKCGSIVAAIKAIHGPQALQMATGHVSQASGQYSKHSRGHIAPTNPNDGDRWTDAVSGQVYVYTTPNGWTDITANPVNPFMNAPMATNIPSNGSLSVGNGGQSYSFHNPPRNVIAIETKLGRISIDIETGDITIPPGIGRDEAIREFWLGFQKYWEPTSKKKYEEEIKYLKRDLAGAKASAVLMKQESEKEASKRVAEKVRKKYGNEKFIMVKPEDLVKFIEEG